MSTNDHIDHLLALTEKLTHCLEQETAMLRTRRSDALAELQREKTRLTQAYEGSLKQLKEGQVTLSRIEPHRFQALTDAAERLQQVLVLNERALRAAKAVNERILTAMVDAIEIQRGKPVGYTGRGGRPPAAPLRRAGMVSAVTIDQRF